MASPTTTKPPNLSTQQSQALQGTQGTDPWNLNQFQTATIQGAPDFFGTPKVQSAYSSRPGVLGPPAYVPAPAMSANDVMTSFTHMSGAQLASVQSQLYRAGYYSGSFVPDYGKLREEDISAFRSMLIGLAANPTVATLKDFLAGAAADGDTMGVNAKTHPPLTISLTSPDDLRITFQKVARDLYGGNLPEGDLSRMVAAYQSLESSSQTAQYNQTYSNAGYGSGGTVTAPPTAANFAETDIRKTHPTEVGTQGFVAAMNDVLSRFLANPPGGTAVSGIR